MMFPRLTLSFLASKHMQAAGIIMASGRLG